MAQPLPSFNESSLPLNYSKWIYEIIQGSIPTEKLATCHDCAMCKKTEEPEESAGLYFDPKVRCCSYIPELPNFLIGRILLENDPKNVPGRDKLIDRINGKLHATPLGLGSGKLYNLTYNNSGDAFGTSHHLRCPYYVENGDLCGIWKHRNSVCSTWFCKHERGNYGFRFWDSVKRLLNSIENDLAFACLKELRLNNDAIHQLLLKKEENEPDNPARLLETPELDHQTDDKNYSTLWGSWAGKEMDYYRQCAHFVNKLSWKEVLALCGPEVPLLIPIVQEAYNRLQESELPEFLETGSLKISQITSDAVLIETYSKYNPLSVPPFIFEILAGFDGSHTPDVLRKLLEEKNMEVDEDFVRILLDYHILVPRMKD